MTPDLRSRIQGCWFGKSIGGTLGIPAEGKMERLNLSFYDPVPTVAPPNDDLELQLVWLHLVETAEKSLTQADFAKAWLNHIHYMWDEYGRCRWNLRRGVPVENVGTFENPFQDSMGSPIRSEIWACLFAGDPDSAAHYAAMDASLDHGVEGIAGEVFFAVMQSEVAAGRSIEESVHRALSYLPNDCEVARALQLVLRNHRAGVPEWDCWKELLARHANDNFTHAPLNLALTVWALFYGKENFEKSVLLAVNGGYDTDCTGATVGATLGLKLGAGGIPRRWMEPIGEDIFVGPGILGLFAPKSVSELTERTIAAIGKLETKKWRNSFWENQVKEVELSGLPGTILISPSDGRPPVPWANGELPAEIKAAGGGTWTWERATNEPRQIVCLARQGARLFIDGELIVECPPGLPYVPATHRSAEGTRASTKPESGTFQVRVELKAKTPEQDASVILVYPNLHICPWTREELPHAAKLEILIPQS
jgi:ADP-ribosylglycohydrolase